MSRVVHIPSVDPEKVRIRDGVQKESLRRRPLGYRRLAAGFGAQEEAELRSKRRLYS